MSMRCRASIRSISTAASKLFVAGYLAGTIAVERVHAARRAARVTVIYDPHLYPRALLAHIELGMRVVQPNIVLQTHMLESPPEEVVPQLTQRALSASTDVVVGLAAAYNRAIAVTARRSDSTLIIIDSARVPFTPTTAVYTARFEQAAQEKVTAALEGRLRYGMAAIVGTREGYFDFGEGGVSGRVTNVTRSAIAQILQRIKTGRLRLRMIDTR